MKWFELQCLFKVVLRLVHKSFIKAKKFFRSWFFKMGKYNKIYQIYLRREHTLLSTHWLSDYKTLIWSSIRDSGSELLYKCSSQKFPAKWKFQFLFLFFLFCIEFFICLQTFILPKFTLTLKNAKYKSIIQSVICSPN